MGTAMRFAAKPSFAKLTQMETHLVWFKRDLRIHDHAPLARAAQRGRVICVYMLEPDMLNAPDFHPAHQVFINQSLKDLRTQLRELGADITVRHGDAVEVLAELVKTYDVKHIWAHEETGTYTSYVRDRRVRAWTKTEGVPFTEIPQGGVVRRLKTRDGWAKAWQKRMNQPITLAPEKIEGVSGIKHGRIPSLKSLGLPKSTMTLAPKGGEVLAHDVLTSFLHDRGQFYRSEMSSPVTAFESCSRLSAYLTWGNISLRQIYQATQTRRTELKKADDPADKGWLASLASFQSRLRWHDHFIQKLEDEPGLEFYNTNRGFDGLRDSEPDLARLKAWQDGQTGYPMVDACMRSLKRTGWLNFRMRAMVTSFASYHLWLHWRATGLHLAKHWIDSEPGIHWSQMQMQSGVTGINTTRIYSPRKQVEDQDPKGVFIRKWVPELRDVPDAYIAEPHTMSEMVQGMAGCIIGQDYPAPIVDPKEAYQEARLRMRDAKRGDEVQVEKARVLERHGSRANPNRRKSKGRKPKERGRSKAV